MIIYIAGPYTSDPEANTDRAIVIADQLFELGHVPIVPHLSHYWLLRSQRPWTYEDWMKIDFVLLSLADAILLMSGLSKGRDREHRLGLHLGKKILHELPPRAPIPTWAGLAALDATWSAQESWEGLSGST